MSEAQPHTGRRRDLFPFHPRVTFARRGEEPGRGALLALSRAAADMGTAPDRVPAVAVRAAMELGCDGASFRVLDDHEATHRPLESAGLAGETGHATSLSARMTDLVLQRGGTVVASNVPGGGEASLPVAAGDAAAAIASPIWVDGWIAAILVGVFGDARVSPDDVAAFELLASYAGLTLDNAQRIEAQRRTAGLLEQSDRLKAEFLTTISHEMRTPLTVLMGNGTTLERTWGELDDESRLELLAGINTNVRTLDGMLQNLLDCSRLEAGELWVSFEPFDISGMLRALCERTADAVGDRHLRTEIEDGLLASGDVVLIRRIVAHLLGNAATHTPAGTTITASCRREDGAVLVAIVDDGPGIAEADLPFLGERFFRGGAGNTRPKGLGLGLALALGILDLHGSTLVIENGADGGARFSFSLPCVPDPALGSPAGDDPPATTT